MGKITVSGKGEVKTVPDIARISFEVRIEKVKCSEAISEVNEKIRDILKMLSDKTEEIKTVATGSDPEYNFPKNGTAKLRGYSAFNSVVATLSRIDDLGDVLTQLASLGATSFSYSWDVTNRKQLEDQARIEAYADAKRKAKIYAKEADTKLGKLLDLSESYRWGRSGAPGALAKQAVTQSVAMEEAPIERGEEVIKIDVNAVFEIK